MRRIKVLIDWTHLKPGWERRLDRRISKRIILATDGTLRVDHKSMAAKTWSTSCWGGSLPSHYAHAVCKSFVNQYGREYLRYWKEIEKAEQLFGTYCERGKDKVRS